MSGDPRQFDEVVISVRIGGVRYNRGCLIDRHIMRDEESYVDHIVDENAKALKDFIREKRLKAGMSEFTEALRYAYGGFMPLPQTDSELAKKHGFVRGELTGATCTMRK